MTPKAIEMPVQLQTGIVVFVKGAVGHSVASYIQSIHLCRIQCGNSILDSFVYGHVIPFHLIFAFSFSSAIIITAPWRWARCRSSLVKDCHSSDAAGIQTVQGFPFSGGAVKQVSLYSSNRLRIPELPTPEKKAAVIAKMIRFTSWGSSVPASRFLLLGPEGKYLYHGVWNCQAAGGAGKTLSLKY